MNIVERRIDKLGRIVLPMDFRRALGLEGEVEVVLDICGNAIVVKAADTACRLCGSTHKVSKHLKICHECITRIKSN